MKERLFAEFLIGLRTDISANLFQLLLRSSHGHSEEVIVHPVLVNRFHERLVALRVGEPTCELAATDVCLVEALPDKVRDS